MNERRFFPGFFLFAFLASLIFSPLFAFADEWKPASGLMVAPGVEPVKVKVVEATLERQELVYSMPSLSLVTNKQFASLAAGSGGTQSVRPQMGNAIIIGDPGKPMLPLVPCKVMIPQGHEIDQVTVTMGDKVQLAGSYVVEHGQRPYPLIDGVVVEYTEQDSQVYGSDDVYPSVPYTVADVQKKRGVTYAYVVLNPVEYKPLSGTVSYYPELTVSVTTRPKVMALGGDAGVSYCPERHAVTDDCDNPDLLTTYTAEPAPDLSSSPQRLKDAPALPCTADDVKYLIVTSKEIRDAATTPSLRDLVALKESKGLSAAIVAMEDIKAAYTGVDDAEKLRNFLKAAYANWGVEYVLLGGDTSVVPMRYLWVDFGQESDDIPSDLYFQCLDGVYNNNGNSKWGEPTDGDGGANVDMLAEVYIGRASAETAQEMANFVGKIIKHEDADDESHLFKAMMVGEHLGFGGISEYAKPLMEEIRLGSSEHGYTTLGFVSDSRYTTDTLYDADGTWAKQDIIDIINSSAYAVFNHLGHCNTDYCMKFVNNDADKLTNYRLSFLYSQGCIPGAFDRDCMGEHLTTSTTNGMYSVVLNARYGWGAGDSTDGASQRFNRPFWHAFFSEGYARLGVMNAYAHEQNIYLASANTIYRWCYVESNLLGDPEVAVDSSGLVNNIALDRMAYRSDAKVTYTVTDTYWDPLVDIPVSIAVEMPGGASRWTSSQLAVNVPGTMMFTNSFVLTSGVTTVEGDLLRASFIDSASNTWEDTAYIDDTPPVLTNVHLIRISEKDAVVGWYSDEISDSSVMVTTAYRQPGYEVGTFTAGYTTNYVVNSGVTQYVHEVTVTGLVDFTVYYAAVASADYAGNTSSLPANLSSIERDDYLVMITQGRETAYESDFDSPSYGWGYTNISGGVCWQRGVATYGPNPKYEGDQCWGTVLAGHYPNLANAWLYSPPVFVKENAKLTFKTWYDIIWNELDYRDTGFIEVNDGSGWLNIYPATYLRGESDGWTELEVDLSQYTNETIQVRFRLETDSSTSAAGWYVDDFKITHTLGGGIYIVSYEVQDTLALSASNDADGFPEVGETFYLDLTLFNANSDTNLQNLTATASITTEGVTLDSGVPTEITYAPFFATGSRVTSGNQLKVSIDDDGSLVGDEISLMHTAVADNGGPWENTLNIEIVDRKTISGTVTDLVSGVGIASAYVFCEPENASMTTSITDSAGSYSINGLTTSGSNLLWATKTGYYSPSVPIVINSPSTDQTGINIGLGKAIATFNPTSLNVTVVSDQSSAVTNFAIRNTDPSANIPLTFEFDSDTYAYKSDRWLSLSPLSGSIAPGNSTSITVTIYPANITAASVSDVMECTINDINTTVGQVPITVTNITAPDLDLLFYYAWAGGDGDGYIEAGESATLWVWLYNSGGGEAVGLSGVLTPDNSNVTVPDPTDTWPDIAAGDYDYNMMGFTYQAAAHVSDGDVLPMTLTVTDAYGRSWEFSISDTVEDWYEISGTVRSTNGTGVAFTDIDFYIASPEDIYSGTTIGDGSYSVYVPGGTYKPYVMPPSPYKYLYPADTNIVVAADVTADFTVYALTNLALPNIELLEVTIVDDDDGDKRPEPGETIDLSFTLFNNGWAGASNLMSQLFSSNGPSVVVNAPSTNGWDTISPHEEKVSYINNSIYISPSVPDGTALWFGLLVTNRFDHRCRWELGFAITSHYYYAISGTVTDPDGNPLEGINVEIASGGVTNDLFTDPNGYYKLDNIPVGGNYTVTAIAPFPYNQPAPTVINSISSDHTVNIQFGAELYASPGSISSIMDENRYSTQIVNVINTGGSTYGFDVDVKIKDGLGGLSSLEAAGYTPPDWSALQSGEDYVPGRLIVRFKDGTTPEQQRQVFEDNGLRCLRKLRAFPAAIVEFSQAYAVSSLASSLALDENVLYTEPDYIGMVNLVPNDTRYPEMYALNNTNQTGGTTGADINAEKAWDVTTGSSNVVVAVVDSGVDITHYDLKANIWSNKYEKAGDANLDGYPGIKGYDDDGDGLVDEDSLDREPGDTGYSNDLADDDDENGYIDDLHGYDFYEDNNDVADDLGHGTHVAGTIAAVGNNNEGVVGVSWNAKIMPLKIGDRYGQVYVSAAIEAIDYAVAKGVKVSNHSWGGYSFSPLLYEMIGYAYSNDHVVVCAAGNDAVDVELTPAYPAAYNHLNVISVASTDDNDVISEFSNYGKVSVDIAAPGEDILSTYPDVSRIGNNYASLSGTSMATPHVSGTIALLLSISPWATVDMMTSAIFEGARHDQLLEGLMVYAGHLDAAASIDIIRAHWINVTPTTGNLVPGTTAFTVGLNTTNLAVGSYEAEIKIMNGSDSLDIPVSLTVLPAEKPVFVSVTVDDNTSLPGTNDGDGYAEPGERVNLYVCMGNEGSAKFSSPKGFLSTLAGDVTINSAAMAWPEIRSGDDEISTNGADVSFGLAAASEIPFTVTVSNGVDAPWSFGFTLPVETRNSITGHVANSSGQNISGALVEYWGGSSGKVTSESNGRYVINNLVPGASYHARVLKDNYAKSGVKTVSSFVSGVGTANFVLQAPNPVMSTNNLTTAVLLGRSVTTNIVITNSSSSSFTFECYEMPYRTVAVISDDHQLDPLVPYLRSMGLQVTSYTNNYDLLDTYYSYAVEWLLTPAVYYSDQDVLIFSNDLVIADISGLGDGRLLLAEEQEVYSEYIERGGKVIFTGVNMLSIPDDYLLASLVGSDSHSRDNANVSEAVLSNALPNTTYVNIGVSNKVYTYDMAYDDAVTDLNSDADVYFRAGNGVKIMRSESGSRGGVAYYWDGNNYGADWTNRTVWLDVLKNFIMDELQEDVSWLTVAKNPASGSIASGDTGRGMDLVLNPSLNLDVGDYRATILIKGNYTNSDERYVHVNLSVTPPILEVKSSSGVTNWMGKFINGNGTETSAVFQVILTGSDNAIDPPRADGGTSDDDILLAQYPYGQAYGRFGAGYEQMPDSGRFKSDFEHDLSPSGSHYVYIRAWDAASYVSSVAYGESSLYNIKQLVNESYDFGTWGVDTPIGYPDPSGNAPDWNGDTIPDGWYIERGMDPRTPITGLTSTGSVETVITSGGLNRPGRIVLSDNFIFVLDSNNHSIKVYNRSTEAYVSSFGGVGTGNGQFDTPQGLAIDPRSSTNRLAVADTKNHRIQILKFNPTTGAITYQTKFGSTGTASGQFDDPYGVAFDSGGWIYVADRDNHRVQIFEDDGIFYTKFGSSGTSDGKMSYPEGLCVDSSGLIWVADTQNHRIQVFSGGGAVIASYKMGSGVASSADGRFNNPSDVQMGVENRIFVCDKFNNRIQVFDSARNHLFSYAVYGSGTDQLNYPQGVAPDADSCYMYIADSRNDRILKVSTVVDGDNDGMEDIWENDNGLNSHTNDAALDPDGDGVSNIGEYRAGLAPQDADSNNNGASDGWDLANGIDPAGAGTPVNPPGLVVTSDAGANSRYFGQTVTITATYDESTASSPAPALTLSGGANLSAAAMTRSSSNIWNYAYTILSGDVGDVDVTVSGAKDLSGYVQDPNPYFSSALFLIEDVEFVVTNVPPSVGESFNGLTWPVVSGGVYQVKYLFDLTTTNWTYSPGRMTSTYDGVMSWTNTAPTNDVYFYRVIRYLQ